jgi:secreted PhoX family phosphatase
MKLNTITLAVATAIAGTAHAGEIQFTNAAVPTNDLDKRNVLTSQFAIVDGEKIDVNYNTLMRSGDMPGGSYAPFGQLFDIDGDPVVDQNGDIRVSNDNDFSSLIVSKKINGKVKALYMVSHFESRPAAMYLTEINQDKKTGELTVEKTRPLDFSHVNGGWVHCAGSVSPWGTHIGSEEYPPNGKQWRDATVTGYNAMMAQYFGVQPELQDLDGDGSTSDDPVANQADVIAAVNPYDYGYTVEVEVSDFDDATVTKHYSMGRVAIELSYVMPNQKTVYTSDDGSRVGLFRYEADVPGDLSAGTLYVAKWHQTSTGYGDNERVSDELRDGGTADISWIELGHATNNEIRDIIDSGVTFADIFDEDVDGCTIISNRDASSECLKVKPGMEQAAAFLETSRYAGILGGTIEFEKMEGITLDPETNTMYLAMSRVIKEMTDGAGDISVPYNYCGTVYGLDLDGDYVATNMYGVVSGIPRTYSRGALVDNPYPANGPYADNECDLLGISEPDNITFIPGYNTLVIGEDTGKHQNDMIWAYNLDNEELTRIQTTPYGSETTSPYIYPDINGFAYMMSVIQHPFGESDKDALKVEDEKRGYTGYVGPLPALTK